MQRESSKPSPRLSHLPHLLQQSQLPTTRWSSPSRPVPPLGHKPKVVETSGVAGPRPMTPLRMAAEFRPAWPHARAAAWLSGLPPEKGGASRGLFGLKPPDTDREDEMSAVCAAWWWGGYVSGGGMGGCINRWVMSLGFGFRFCLGAVETFACHFDPDLTERTATTFRGSKHPPNTRT